MSCLRTIVLGMVVCGGFLFSHAAVSLAADPAKTPAKADKAEKAKAAGRLPAHYGEVVDAKQREAIYAIQQQYTEKVNQLKADLDALIKQRDAKIEGVLTPEQKQKIADLAATAKAKREAGKKSDPAPKKSVAAPEAKAAK